MSTEQKTLFATLICSYKKGNVIYAVAKSKDEYLPGEQAAADKAVKKCICRELKRIEDLFGSNSIPDEWMHQMERYCNS